MYGKEIIKEKDRKASFRGDRNALNPINCTVAWGNSYFCFAAAFADNLKVLLDEFKLINSVKLTKLTQHEDGGSSEPEPESRSKPVQPCM